MEDDLAQASAAEPRPRRPWRLPVVAAGLLALLALTGAATLWGASEAGWITWHGFHRPAPAAAARPMAAAPVPRPVIVPEDGTQAAMNLRLAELEQRIARLDLQSAAAEENAARAEGLMIAFAVRRAIERGLPLGFLEHQLHLRFGDAQPNAAATLIDSATRPVTRERLIEGLDDLAPKLAGGRRGEGTWQRLERELAGLFVVRKASIPSPLPERRVERARAYLEAGRIDAALNEIERLPQRAVTAEWRALARRYDTAQRALDLIETAALLEPKPAATASQAAAAPSI